MKAQYRDFYATEKGKQLFTVFSDLFYSPSHAVKQMGIQSSIYNGRGNGEGIIMK